MRAVATIALLTLTLLAGCASDEPKPEQLTLADGTTIDLGEGTSDTKGAIVGYVVDEAIRPLDGVTITIPGRDTVSDAQGFFRFDLVEPGFYAVTATAFGYTTTQSGTDVVAGETSTVKLQVTTSSAPQPYHETFPFDAYMQAWGTIGQWAVEIVAPTPLCQCAYTVPIADELTGLVIEGFWDGTVPDPAGLTEFYWEAYTDGAEWLDSGYCASPCNVQPDLSDYAGGDITVRISGPDAWVAYQQQVRLFTTAFYNQPVPEGFSVAGAP